MNTQDFINSPHPFLSGILVHRLQATRLKLAQSRKPDLHAALPIGG